MINLFAPLLVVTALAVCALLYYGRYQPWREKKQSYIARYTKCGALPPAPTPEAWRKFRRIVRFLIFIQVGRVRFQGLQHAHIPGPKLITPNHGSSADVAMALAFPTPFRSLATRGLFTLGNGLGALMFGPVGAIPVDLTPGQGGPARNTAVDIVVSGEPLLMFPEGWAYMDGRIGPMKKGAVRIAREAARELGQPVHIVPAYMRYGKYPGKWILRFAPPVQYLLAFVLFPLYRRGLTVVFAPPIKSDDLPEDDTLATQMLRDAILAADPQG